VAAVNNGAVASGCGSQNVLYPFSGQQNSLGVAILKPKIRPFFFKGN